MLLGASHHFFFGPSPLQIFPGSLLFWRTFGKMEMIPFSSTRCGTATKQLDTFPTAKKWEKRWVSWSDTVPRGEARRRRPLYQAADGNFSHGKTMATSRGISPMSGSFSATKIILSSFGLWSGGFGYRCKRGSWQWMGKETTSPCFHLHLSSIVHWLTWSCKARSTNAYSGCLPPK